MNNKQHNSFSRHSQSEKSDSEMEKIKLTQEQKSMLEMSENDIRSGRLISQQDMDKADLEWLHVK